MVPERDLFANFERMRREIDELFGDVFGRSPLGHARRAGFFPLLDVAYAQDPPRAIVTAALPGVRLDDLELEITGRRLRIAGRRHPVTAEGLVYQQIEIQHGPFERSVDLAGDVVAEQTKATLEDGLLCIELPLAVSEGRSIPVEVAPASGASGATGQAPPTASAPDEES